MAWNEPGKGKDPQSGGGNRNKNNGNNDGPPDLEQIWKKLRDRFAGQGKRRPNRGGNNGGGSSGGGHFGGLAMAIVPIIVAIWLATGLYVVQPGEQGVLLRLGKYIETVKPGWHWNLPYPITRVLKVDTQQVRRLNNRAVMLTRDENIVDVEVSVQYRIDDSMRYLFQLQDPDDTVKQVLRSAVREIVGTSAMNQVIQEGVKVNQLEDKALDNVNLKEGSGKPEDKNGLKDIDKKLVKQIKKKQKEYPEVKGRSRAKLPDNVRSIMQYTLDQYDSGIELVAVNVQYAQPPEEVQSAFQDAIEAREEEERAKNIARAYARDIVARAQGDKARMMARANAYKQRKVDRAKGQAARFTAVMKEYQKAPQVTRKRLYLETMGDVLSASHLVLNDGTSDSLTYLPLDKLMEKSSEDDEDSEDEDHDNHEDSDTDELDEYLEDSDIKAHQGSSDSDQHNESDTDNSRSRGRNS